MEFAKLDGDLTMDSGDLQGDGLQGPLSLSTKAKDVNFRNLKGDVHINDDHGDINLESTVAAELGNLDLTTHHGDVHLRLPPKANFQYQVTTRHGEISTDFASLRAENHTGASTATGTVGKGGVKISVTSDTGDIAIDKSEGSTAPEAAAPEPPAKPVKPDRPGKKVGRCRGDVETGILKKPESPYKLSGFVLRDELVYGRSTEVDWMLPEPMGVTGGTDFAHGSAGDSGGELAGLPGDPGGKADEATDHSHGNDGSGIWFAALDQQTAERTEAGPHHGRRPGGTRGSREDLGNGLFLEQ